MGKGGYTVYGRLMPAAASLAGGHLPIGLAHGVRLTRAVEPDTPLTWADVTADEDDAAAAEAVRTRRRDGGGVRAGWARRGGARLREETMPKHLSAEAIAAFERDGFCFPVQAISAAEAGAIRADVEAAERHFAERGRSNAPTDPTWW